MTEPLIDRGYGSMEVAEAAGIAYQTLHRWCVAGAVTPSIDNGGGTGRPRRWSHIDLGVLTDIATVELFMEADLPYSLVARLWQEGHRWPTHEVLELQRGSVTLSVDRRERRAEVLVRRGLEEA